MISGEINFKSHGLPCRITFNNTTFPRSLVVWGEYSTGKRDWNGDLIWETSCQCPSSYSKDKSSPEAMITEAFNHVHQNLESNTAYHATKI